MIFLFGLAKYEEMQFFQRGNNSRRFWFAVSLFKTSKGVFGASKTLSCSWSKLHTSNKVFQFLTDLLELHNTCLSLFQLAS